MRVTVLVATVCFVGAVGFASAFDSQEKKIQKKDLPPAVAKAMEQETQGATVKGFAKEIEDGKTFYEVETVKNGHTRDILFTEDGAIAEVEEEVAIDSLPAAVKTALSAQGKLQKVETVTKKGSTIYEGHFAKGAKKSEVKVSADGKQVTEP
jgi:uncharacterized membrane protein YkoI